MPFGQLPDTSLSGAIAITRVHKRYWANLYHLYLRSLCVMAIKNPRNEPDLA